ncbi:MAG: FAD:protein FMN transferase, partial [Actinobacteria bacterium]
MSAVAAPPGVRRVEHIMGMPIVVDVRDESVDEAVLDRMFDWFRRVDATFSTYKDDSEISRLGRGE